MQHRLYILINKKPIICIYVFMFYNNGRHVSNPDFIFIKGISYIRRRKLEAQTKDYSDKIEVF